MTISKKIEVENLDHLGIIAGIIDELRIPEIINERLGIEAQEKINSGQIVKAIIINGLGFVSRPLYLFPQFFRNKAVEKLLGEGIKIEHINDDKIGRVMDKLFCHGLSELFVEIVLNAINKYQISTKELVRKISSSELVKSELDGYSWCVKESNYGGIAQRWLVVESAARKESDLDKLEKNINKEYREKTQKLKEICRSKYEHQSCLDQALKSLEKSLKYHHLSEIEIKEVSSNSWSKTENNTPEVTQYKVTAILVKDTATIELYERRAGRFILATNILDEAELTPDEILAKYKEQQCAERGFRFLKDPLFFADSVFLKSPERIETMAMLMGLCLLVYNLGQRELRAALTQCNTGIKNQLGKLTKTPTLRWIFQCFQGIHYVKLNGEEEVVNLTDDRWWILSFFPDACQGYYLL